MRSDYTILNNECTLWEWYLSDRSAGSSYAYPWFAEWPPYVNYPFTVHYAPVKTSFGSGSDFEIPHASMCVTWLCGLHWYFPSVNYTVDDQAFGSTQVRWKLQCHKRSVRIWYSTSFVSEVNTQKRSNWTLQECFPHLTYSISTECGCWTDELKDAGSVPENAHIQQAANISWGQNTILLRISSRYHCDVRQQCWC
jgi:hypothetical protein